MMDRGLRIGGGGVPGVASKDPARMPSPIELNIPVVQAALSGYSDLAMRRVARAHGAPYALAEVVLDELVIRRGKERRRILGLPEDDHPVGGQLMGSQPSMFGDAAKDLVIAGYDVVDINFGCPVSKVLGRCRGGFLLSDPDTALEIVERVLQSVAGDVPVTVKMRRGMDDSEDSERSFFQILDGVYELGVSAVTLHARTVRQRYQGPSRWSFLKLVKERVGHHVLLGSGDLFSAVDAHNMMEETGVDGVSLARGCIGNPWIFEQVGDLFAGREPKGPGMVQMREAIELHWRHATELYGSEKAVRKVRRHAIKYAQLHPEPVRARDAFVAAFSDQALSEVLDEFYDESRYLHYEAPLTKPLEIR